MGLSRNVAQERTGRPSTKTLILLAFLIRPATRCVPVLCPAGKPASFPANEARPGAAITLTCGWIMWRLPLTRSSQGIASGWRSKINLQDQPARSTWRSRTMAKQLEKSQWRAYFDRMSKALVGKRAEIEVASLKLGDQIEAEWLPLLGISYDPKDDIIEIALEGVDHLIPKPREVYVEEKGLELSSLEVIDAEGTHQIIVLKDPMMLPAPAQSTAKAS